MGAGGETANSKKYQSAQRLLVQALEGEALEAKVATFPQLVWTMVRKATLTWGKKLCAPLHCLRCGGAQNSLPQPGPGELGRGGWKVFRKSQLPGDRWGPHSHPTTVLDDRTRPEEGAFGPITVGQITNLRAVVPRA